MQEEADRLADAVREALAEWAPDSAAVVFGPHRCPIERLRSLYRFELLVRMRPAGRSKVLHALQSSGVLKSRVKQLTVDCDPVALM